MHHGILFDRRLRLCIDACLSLVSSYHFVPVGYFDICDAVMRVGLVAVVV